MGASRSRPGEGAAGQRQADLIAPLWRATAERSSPPFSPCFCAYRAHVRARWRWVAAGKPRPLSLALAYASSSQAANPPSSLLRGCSGSGKGHLAGQEARPPGYWASTWAVTGFAKQTPRICSHRQRTSGQGRGEAVLAEIQPAYRASLLGERPPRLERLARRVAFDAPPATRQGRSQRSPCEQQRIALLILNLHRPRG